MKTALLTHSYLVGTDLLGSNRFERVRRFLDWHLAHRLSLGVDEIFISDNASPTGLVNRLRSQGVWLRYQDHIERVNCENGYLYCWRHLYTTKMLIELGYEKIIYIDSDCLLVSQRMVERVRALNDGWTAFWIAKYQFPSAELHVLCKDAFRIFHEFTKDPYPSHLGKLMERALPFTRVDTEMAVDRWGETNLPQEPWMDAYCQAPVSMPLEFQWSR